MDDLARLVAIEDIKQVKAKYFRGVDMKDRALLLSVFAEDATADFRGATVDPRDGSDAAPVALGEVLRGGTAIADLIIDAGTRMESVHHGSIPEIEILDQTTARAIWPMVDRLRFKPGAPVAELVGYGHYHETYEKTDGSWKIKTTKLTRLRVDNIRR